MNYIKERIIDHYLKKENITFAIFQHKQPVKYICLPSNMSATDIHYKFSTVVDCSAIIKDVFVANSQDMTQLPFKTVNIPIHEFLNINKKYIGFSFHYKYGLAIDIYVIDEKCINNLLENRGINPTNFHLELTNIYPKMTDNKRKNYVNNIVTQISSS